MSRRGAVNSIAVHPSGRLALSVASDKNLRMWDLTKGRPALTVPLGAEARVVRWSTDGASYVLMFDAEIRVCDGSTGATITTLLPALAGSRLLDMALVSRPGFSAVIVAGCEGGDVVLWDAWGKWRASFATGHARRVRCVAVVDRIEARAAASAAAKAVSASTLAPPPASLLSAKSSEPIVLPNDGPFLATIGSDCIVHLWQLDTLLGVAATAGKDAATTDLVHISTDKLAGPVATLSWGAGARPTCMASSGGTTPGGRDDVVPAAVDDAKAATASSGLAPGSAQRKKKRVRVAAAAVAGPQLASNDAARGVAAKTSSVANHKLAAVIPGGTPTPVQSLRKAPQPTPAHPTPAAAVNVQSERAPHTDRGSRAASATSSAVKTKADAATKKKRVSFK